jgi:hypothetical protein
MHHTLPDMISSLFSGLAGPTSDEDIEQLGKRDDDIIWTEAHGPAAGLNMSIWYWCRSAFRMRKKRMVVFVAALLAIWFLFTHRLQDMLPSSASGFNEQGGGDIDVSEFSSTGTADGSGLLGNRPHITHLGLSSSEVN